MKNLFLALFVILLSGCAIVDKENTTQFVRTYVNASGHDIELISYNSDDSNFKFKYWLPANSSTTMHYGPEIIIQPQNYMVNILNCDSVRAIFGEDEREMVWHADWSQLNEENTPIINTLKYKEQKNYPITCPTFTFTREMYDAATPIEK
ncbi:MAG: hypothetical protein E7128_05775 [Rikenellaceae bacterium]|nr:hypothetical protein [Rikenellaceae bacterium]